MEAGVAGLPQGKILAVDDDPRALEALEAVLKGAGLEVLTVSGGEKALRVARVAVPDVVLLDLVMPGMSGHEVLRELKARAETSDIPVVVVTAVDESEEKEAAIRAGADDFLAKPVEPRELLVRIRTLLKVKRLHRDLDRTLKYLHELEAARYAEGSAQEPPKGPASRASLATVLIVEDELLERAIYADLLRDHGYTVISAPTAPQALELLRFQPVDVVLVDLVLPGMSGPELIERLKTVSPETPVIVVTAHPTSHNAITALKLGAFDFIVKGFKSEVMLHAVKRAVEKRQLELQTQTLLQELKSKVDRLSERQA
ncbi:MAG: response regulator [Candidatus Methylomirabilales bacterium]